MQTIYFIFIVLGVLAATFGTMIYLTQNSHQQSTIINNSTSTTNDNVILNKTADTIIEKMKLVVANASIPSFNFKQADIDTLSKIRNLGFDAIYQDPNSDQYKKDIADIQNLEITWVNLNGGVYSTNGTGLGDGQ